MNTRTLCKIVENMKEVKQSMVARVDDKNDRLKKVLNLRSMYLKGLLGGEIMPEDNNPNLPKTIS